MRLLRDAAAELDAAGLRGWFLARNLSTGEEIGIDPEAAVPMASLVKIPLAMAILDGVRSGAFDDARPIVLKPGRSDALGPVGLPKFRHEAVVALGDVVYLSTALSDTIAADALFELVPPDALNRHLQQWDVHGFVVRHRMADLTEAPAEVLMRTPQLAQTLATRGGTPSGGHRIERLDVARANTATARACVDLLSRLWTEPSPIDATVAARVRAMMRDNVMRQRLWPDFASDAATWSSKTGTLLNLRHEIGVVEYRDGEAYALAALTESQVPAAVQPFAEAAMARVARGLCDHLRH
jgi:beta-lactamase class A